LVLCVVASTVSAQTAGIENATDDVLVYTFVRTQESVSADSARRAISQASSAALSYLPPRGVLPVAGLAEGKVLVGALVGPGVSEHPVVVEADPVDGYFVVSEGDTVRDEDGGTAAVGKEAVRPVLSAEPVLVDNEYGDWVAFDPIAAFSPGFPPEEYEYTRAGETRTLPLSESLYWGKAGTGIDAVKSVLSNRFAYLMIETRNEIVPGISYFLYGYDRRDRSSAVFTLELAVTRRGAGSVYLWVPGRDEPRVVGSVVSEPFFLEARAELARVPRELADMADAELSFDLTAAYTGGRVTEEFFYTTVYARNIVFRSPSGM
jgi:hypothetical protein